MLRHHQVVLLRSIDALLTVDGSHAELDLVARATLAYLANSTEAAGDDVVLAVVLGAPLPVRVLLVDFRAVPLHPHDVARHADDLVLVVHLVEAMRVARRDDVLILIGKPSDHHVSGARSALSYDSWVHD